MHVDEQVLEPVRTRYGEPVTLEFEGEISRRERDIVVQSTQRDRFHDVTFFVFRGDRLALIQKPHYTEGLWRPPGGGLRPGEPFEAGVEREAFEELGARIALTRYLVVSSAVFGYTPCGPSARGRGSQPARCVQTGNTGLDDRPEIGLRPIRGTAAALPRTEAIPWTTHVLAATTADVELAPVDTHEISAARWGTLAELQGPIRKRLLATGTTFWRYRVALHDAAAAALEAGGG